MSNYLFLNRTPDPQISASINETTLPEGPAIIIAQPSVIRIPDNSAFGESSGKEMSILAINRAVCPMANCGRECNRYLLECDLVVYECDIHKFLWCKPHNS